MDDWTFTQTLIQTTGCMHDHHNTHRLILRSKYILGTGQMESKTTTLTLLCRLTCVALSCFFHTHNKQQLISTFTRSMHVIHYLKTITHTKSVYLPVHVFWNSSEYCLKCFSLPFLLCLVCLHPFLPHKHLLLTVSSLCQLSHSFLCPAPPPHPLPNCPLSTEISISPSSRLLH